MGLSLGYGLMLATLAEAVSMGNANLSGGLYADRPATPTVGMIYAASDRLLVSVCIEAGAWLELPGEVRGEGTLAARPATPDRGDAFAVTSGPSVGSRALCFVPGTWDELPAGFTVEDLLSLTEGGGETNLFHLNEASGAFVDRGSTPATLTEEGVFRRARLGPRALVPGLWPPVSPAGTYLSFPAAFGSYADLPFSVGITIRGNGESGPSGKILMAGWGASPVHEVVWVDATHVRGILHHASIGPVLGPLIAVDPTKPLRILYTYVYHSPWLYVNGVGTNCESDWSFTNNGFTDVLALIEATGFAANDLEFWGVTLTADQAVADYERFASSFRY